ncbi:uncharacterized protein B0H18DRAFT_865748, partial [Fomitopsis serialis]|uniref:uncharacterized protein n=1 Tax=Fomitopsis serialis TaxID=139415 RepID=UPI002008AE80
YQFETIHFSWYNRHCTKGHEAPDDVPPQMMSRSGVSRTNYGQLIPYTSKDMEDHRSIYQSLKSILGDVFSWIEHKLQHVLPGEYRHLEATADILPEHHRSLANPFVSLVVNLNVATYAHRDSKDDTICLVLPIGDFKGAEL